MQSAALGFMLAQAHFADPLVAVPSAVSVVFMVRTPSQTHLFAHSRLEFVLSSLWGVYKSIFAESVSAVVAVSDPCFLAAIDLSAPDMSPSVAGFGRLRPRRVLAEQASPR